MEAKFMILSCIILLAISITCADVNSEDLANKAKDALNNLPGMDDVNNMLKGIESTLTGDLAGIKRKLAGNAQFAKESQKLLTEHGGDPNSAEYKEALKNLVKKYGNGARGMTASVISVVTALALLVFVV